MSAPRAVFRLDASAAVGGGHATRCLVLAQALARMGWHVTLTANAEATTTVPALAAFPLVVAGEDDLAVLAGLAPFDLLVIDHYGRDRAFETACRPFARQVLVLDDLRREHDCDLLLDQNLGSRPGDYAGRVPPCCQVLAGPTFALLRPAFPAARAAALARRDGTIGRVLVCFGMADGGNLTAVALDGLARSGVPLAVDVAIGPAAPWLTGWRDRPGCALHVGADAEAMARLASGADLLVGAAGSVVWEACCLGLPQVLAITADNQRPGALALEQAGAARIPCRHGGLEAQAVADTVAALAADTARILEMSRAAATVCDGLGPERVVQRCLFPTP